MSNAGLDNWKNYDRTFQVPTGWRVGQRPALIRKEDGSKIGLLNQQAEAGMGAVFFSSELERTAWLDWWNEVSANAAP